MKNGEMRKCAVTTMAGVALMLASGSAHARIQARTPDSTAANRAFVTDVIQGDLAQIQVGKLAREKGASDAVKQLGQRLESDHSVNLEKAKPLAESLGVTPPAAPKAKQKAAYDKLSSLSGREFDRRFAKIVVQDHKKDIKAFQKESKGSGAAADFAKQTLPTLQEHLKLAKSLRGSAS